MNDLEMKYINSQETIQFLLTVLQQKGINVFNKYDLKDDSESQTQAKKKLLKQNLIGMRFILNQDGDSRCRNDEEEQ